MGFGYTPVRILIAGDTHGNARFITEYLFPMAVCLGVDQIIQDGDFGYWEHHPDGVVFLDEVDRAASLTSIPWYWLHGNHDKHSLLLKKYKRRTIEGFIEVRPMVIYLPQGASWMWQDDRMLPYSKDNARAVTARAFGGAYSVDKAGRLQDERDGLERQIRRNEGRKEAGQPTRPLIQTKETLWFPEEEMTDAEMDAMLAEDSDPRTIVFSHDKPRSSNPGWNRKDIPECLPNQDRLQRALLAHQPRFWVHGHLHQNYVHTVRSGDDSAVTAVVGLGCDDNASPDGMQAHDSFAVLDVTGSDAVLIQGRGSELKVGEDDFLAAYDRLQP